MKAIRNNRPGIYDAGGMIRLLPGINKLDTAEKEEAWEKAKKNDVVLARLKSSARFPGGELQEIELAKKPKVKPPKVEEVPGTKDDDDSVEEVPEASIVAEPEEPAVTAEVEEVPEASIVGLSRKEALSVIGETDDSELLLKFMEQTKDPVVKKAIKTNLSENEE